MTQALRSNLLKLAVAASLAVAGIGTVQAQALRPEVAKPLQQASELTRAGKGREALAKVREAEAVGGKTSAEQTMIDRVKVSAAQRAGDTGTAIATMESLVNSGRVSGNEAAQYAEQLAFAYSAQKNNARASQWATKAQTLGSNSANLRQLQAYLQGAGGDYSTVAKEAGQAVSAAEQAGRRPGEDDLLRLADAQRNLKNTAGYNNTVDKLLTYYPKHDYWALVLARLPSKEGFASRFALDVYRLKLATGNLKTTDEYMEMAQLALQADSPTEAQKVVDAGYASGVLGTGDQAARHQRLKALVAKQLADFKANADSRAADAKAKRDLSAMLSLGTAFAYAGKADQGIALIEDAIATGQLRNPQDGTLRLGQAQILAGKASKAKGVQTLRGVQSKDGAQDLAKLYTILANTHG